jgi:hypothetical protein
VKRKLHPDQENDKWLVYLSGESTRYRPSHERTSWGRTAERRVQWYPENRVQRTTRTGGFA